MAHPPPAHAPSAPPPDPKILHDATVKELERVLDAYIAGQRPPAGTALEIVMPLIRYPEAVLTDVRARYVAAGWAKATISDKLLDAEGNPLRGPDDEPLRDPRGLVLHLTPPAMPAA